MIHGNELLILILFCGSFFLICGSTFGWGLRLILRYVGINNRFAPLFYALLLAVIAFEFALIGSVLDPRGFILDWRYVFRISAYVGIVAFLGVIVIGYLYFLLFRIIGWLYESIANSLRKRGGNR